MGRARTLLVGGNDVFLDGVVDWMTQDPKFEVVGRASTGARALVQIRALQVELVLVDEIVADMSGFEIARRIKERADAPLVVLLSFHDSHAARLEAWAAGADGFVAKSEITECLTPLVGDLLRRRHADVQELGSVSLTRPVPPKDVSE